MAVYSFWGGNVCVHECVYVCGLGAFIHMEVCVYSGVCLCAC